MVHVWTGNLHTRRTSHLVSGRFDIRLRVTAVSALRAGFPKTITDAKAIHLRATPKLKRIAWWGRWALGPTSGAVEFSWETHENLVYLAGDVCQCRVVASLRPHPPCSDGTSSPGNAAGKCRPFPDTIPHIPRETRQLWNAFRYARAICHMSYLVHYAQFIACDKQMKKINFFFWKMMKHLLREQEEYRLRICQRIFYQNEENAL